MLAVYFRRDSKYMAALATTPHMGLILNTMVLLRTIA